MPADFEGQLDPTSTRNTTGPMPDVAAGKQPGMGGALDWVGMAGMEMPVHFEADDGTMRRAPARVGAFVNLCHPDQRGIHMSRLYLLVDKQLTTRALDASMLESLLRDFLDSHRGISDRARIDIRFEHMVRRRALVSGNHGWRTYPVRIEARLDPEGFDLELITEVVYSSTCPASAALSRQLVQTRFAADFDAAATLDHARVMAWLGSEHGIVATPHAQRSVARVRVRFVKGAGLNLIALLDRIEHSLRTPVQTAVKREDEQAFALANGENPMFCEDAVRRIRRALDGAADIAAFHVRVEHRESLHAHDAVAEVAGAVPVRDRTRTSSRSRSSRNHSGRR